MPKTLILIALLLAGAARGETLYITNEKDNTVVALDAASLEIVATAKVGKRPRGIALLPDAKTLFVAATDSDRIEVIDRATLQTLAGIKTNDPETVAVDPRGVLLYVANEDASAASIFDLASRRQVAQIPVGVEPEGLAPSPDGKLLAVTSETTSMVHVVDVAARAVIANVLVGSRPRAAAWTSDC